jgi:hypothetical protein
VKSPSSELETTKRTQSRELRWPRCNVQRLRRNRGVACTCATLEANSPPASPDSTLVLIWLARRHEHLRSGQMALFDELSKKVHSRSLMSCRGMACVWKGIASAVQYALDQEN